MLYHSNRMHDAVVSKLIATSRGSPCDSMASCLCFFPPQRQCPADVDDVTEMQENVGQENRASNCTGRENRIRWLCLVERQFGTKCLYGDAGHDVTGIARREEFFSMDGQPQYLSTPIMSIDIRHSKAAQALQLKSINSTVLLRSPGHFG